MVFTHNCEEDWIFLFEVFLNTLSNIFCFVQPFFLWIKDILEGIPYMAWVCLLLGILLVVGSFYFIKYLIRKEKNPQKENKSQEETSLYKLPPIGGWVSEFLSRKGLFKIGRLSLDFLNSLSFLETSLKCSHYKYKNPWFLVLGAESSGKTTLMKSIYSIEADWQVKRADKYDTECNWYFMRNGVALDISGKFFLKKEQVSADERGWGALKNLLIRYRSAKPIDSILLTISMEDLYGKNRLSSLQCLERAKFISQKLSIFQDQLGLKIPVYVVMTKTDLVPGFHEFCNHIPLGTKQNMFGWSSPYTTDISFSQKWILEAIDSVVSQIRHVNMDTFCEDLREQFNDSLFVFPYELKKIYDNLSIYMNQIFKIDHYKIPLLLRGIYFCGDSNRLPLELSSEEFIDIKLLQSEKIEKNEEGMQKNEEEKELMPEREQYKRIFFFGDLIYNKIIPEYALCIPQKGKYFAANRKLKAIKISAVSLTLIGSVGIYSACQTLSKSKEILMPAVNSMYRFLVRTQQIPIMELTKKNAEFEDSVRKLSRVMQKLSEARLFSIFVPASWFSPLKSKLNEAINLAYQNVIMRALYVNLLLKARELFHLKPEDIQVTTSLAQLALPTKSNEFIAMNNFVVDLTNLSDFVDKFNDLRLVASPKILAELTDYAFKMTLSDSFLKYYGQMKGKLSTSAFPAIDLNVYKNLARKTFSSLFQNFFNTIFIYSNPKSFPGQLEQIIKKLRHVDANSNLDLDYLRNLSADLNIVLQSFDKGQSSGETNSEIKSTWMDKDVFEPNQEFEDFLCSIDKSPFLGPDISQAIVNNCAVGMFHLRKSLCEITALLTTDIRFTSPEDNKINADSCSSGIILLGKALKTLFSEPYMGRPRGHQFIDKIPEGQILYWDDKLLKAACELCSQYEDFSTKKVGNFPVVLQESFRLLARDGLYRNIISLIAQAQNFISLPKSSQNHVAIEEMIRSQTANVRLVYPQFLKLLELLNYESVSFFYVTLRDLLLETNYWLLDKINDLMKKIGPYHIWDPSFSWWDGQSSPAYPAYGVKDAQDLNSFLNIQGQHVINLGINLAKPVVDFLTSDIMLAVNPLNRVQLTKWKRIVEQAESYQNKQPGNSIAVLETFITTAFKGYKIENAFEEINMADLREKVGDHFLETIQFIKKGVLGRAEVLIRQKNIKNYQDLVQFFNKNLRGKFPFTPSSTDVSQGVEVDPEDFRMFLEKFKQYGGSVEKILDQIYQLGSVSVQAVIFLRRIEQIAALFEDFLNNDSVGLPSINFSTEFNVNRERSAGTNYVAEWSIKVNYESSINQVDKNKKTQWIYGCPTEVSFRWPNVSGMVELPLNDPKQSSLKVLETTATFSYKGKWSFLRMVRRHKAHRGDYFPMANPNSVVLKFVVPVSEKKSAVLFNAVSFLGTSTNPNLPGKALILPDFPTLAPSLPQDIDSYRNEPVLSFGIIKPVLITDFR